MTEIKLTGTINKIETLIQIPPKEWILATHPKSACTGCGRDLTVYLAVVAAGMRVGDRMTGVPCLKKKCDKTFTLEKTKDD